MRGMTIAAALVLAIGPLAVAHGQSMDAAAGNAAIKWGPVPPVLPKGAQMAVLSGDPSKAALYVVRLKMPSGYVIPAHHHPTTENVTVLTGAFHAGMGDKTDKTKGMLFGPGGFAAIPDGMNHYAWTSAPTIVQVHGMGPFTIDYVNPAEDPSKAK